MRVRCPLHCVVVAILALACVHGCARTVNDYLVEARSGEPEAIGRAVEEISRQISRKESAGIPFDEGDRAAIEYLRELAVDSSISNHRALAIRGLGRLTTVDASDLFIKGLDDSFWLTRLEAVEAIRNHPDDQFVEPLLKRLESEERVEVRIALVKTLGVIGGDRVIKGLYGIYLAGPLSQNQDEKIHAYRALRRLTGLTHEFQERQSWEESFERRFPGEGAPVPPSAGDPPSDR